MEVRVCDMGLLAIAIIRLDLQRPGVVTPAGRVEVKRFPRCGVGKREREGGSAGEQEVFDRWLEFPA